MVNSSLFAVAAMCSKTSFSAHNLLHNYLMTEITENYWKLQKEMKIGSDRTKLKLKIKSYVQ